MKKKITLLRSGNRMVVDPTTDRVKRILSGELSYEEKVFFRGKEKAMRKAKRLPVVDTVTWQCFSFDHRGRLATSFGFYERIKKVLEEHGYPVEWRYATEEEAERAQARLEKEYKPRWDRIEALEEEGFKFLYKQRKALQIIASSEHARIDCPPGWGKGTIIRLVCTLFPKAKIAVVTRRVPVLEQRLFPELTLNLPSVGIVGGGRRIKDRRVMCYTAGSLGHAKGDEDIVLYDECHEAASDGCAEKMGIFEHARMFGFSATHDMRLDNKDMRCEALFGPIKLRVPYEKAVEHNMVVPIEVYWSDVVMDVNPCSGLEDEEKKRYGIWANEYRNKLIARDAREYEDQQVLITVETVEHALYLRKLLPEFKIVYSGAALKPYQIRAFRKAELIDESFAPMEDEYRQKLTRRFEKGKLKKVIATPVWNVGVNFRHLEVLIRADAGGSPINDTQIPGRTSRKNDVGKVVGIVRDYRDQFDAGFHQKAGSRETSYEKNGWKQHFPDKRERSRLRQQMEWGDD